MPLDRVEMGRVKRLHYQLVWLNPLGFKVHPNAQPLDDHNFDGFHVVSLTTQELVVDPIISFDEEYGAREVLEHLLKGWEVEWDLKRNVRVRFDFVRCEMESGATHEEHGIHRTAAFATAFQEFPELPSLHLENTALVVELRSYLHGIGPSYEDVGQRANQILLRLEDHFGRKSRFSDAMDSKTETKLNYDHKVRKKLVDLAARDRKTSRKAKDVRPLEDHEKRWLACAARRLVLRAAKVESGIKRSKLRKLTCDNIK